jgi:hypothetical protein
MEGVGRKEGRSRNYDRDGWLRIQTFATERPKKPTKNRGFVQNPGLSIFLFAALPADPATPTLAPGSCGGECSCHSSSLPSTTTASAGWTVLLGVGLALGLIAALVGLVAFYLKRK